MDFFIKNYGPISKSHLNIRPLTLITGKNSTGKTYLCQSFYMFYNYLSETIIDYINSYRDTLIFELNNFLRKRKMGNKQTEIYEQIPFTTRKIIKDYRYLSQLLLNSTNPILDNLFSSDIQMKIDKLLTEELLEEIQKYLQFKQKDKFNSKLLDNIFHEAFTILLNTNLNKNIDKFYDLLEQIYQNDVDTLNLNKNVAFEINYNTENIEFYLTYNYENQIKIIANINEFNVEVYNSTNKIIITIPQFKYKLALEKNENGIIQLQLLKQFLESIILESSIQIFNNELQTSTSLYYLPAARSGLLQAYRTITSSIIRSSSRIALSKSKLVPLSLIVTEFLSNLIELPKYQRIRYNRNYIKNKRAIVKYLELELLHGRVSYQRSEESFSENIVFSQGDIELSISNASSMISELAPFILYLKYLLKKGDTVIFEEPESHLHPEAQRILARAIVLLVNSGLRFIITTHSDYFINQLNNLIQAKQLSKDKIQELDLEENMLLKSEDVSFILLKEANNGLIESVPIKITSEGFEEDTFTMVAESLYNENVKISNLITEQED